LKFREPRVEFFCKYWASSLGPAQGFEGGLVPKRGKTRGERSNHPDEMTLRSLGYLPLPVSGRGNPWVKYLRLLKPWRGRGRKEGKRKGEVGSKGPFGMGFERK